MTPHPTAPRPRGMVQRSPVFYGWIVWAVATIGWIATSPGQAFSISLFMDDFIRDFGLDRTTLSGLFALGTLIGSASLTLIGRNIDRYGNRRVGMVIALLFGLALVLWSWVASPLALLMGFILIRTLGQGALSLVNTTAIAAWFWRRRGFVMSLSLTVFALWQAAYVPIMQRLLEHMDWHQVWVLLGLAIWLIVLPLTALLLRDKPEQHGLQPDGDYQGRINLLNLKEDNWTLAESMHTPIFWIFVTGRIVSPAWGSALVLHNISVFASLGYSSRVAVETFSQVMLLSAGLSLVFGWLIDRIRPGWVLALQVFGLLGTLFALMLPPNPLLLPLYIGSFAMVMGGGAVFDTSAWTNLFGRENQGAIRGFVTTILIAATALGPILFGLSYDIFGSYRPVLLLGIMLSLPTITLCLFTNKPRHRWVQPAQPMMRPAVGD